MTIGHTLSFTIRFQTNPSQRPLPTVGQTPALHVQSLGAGLRGPAMTLHDSKPEELFPATSLILLHAGTLSVRSWGRKAQTAIVR